MTPILRFISDMIGEAEPDEYFHFDRILIVDENWLGDALLDSCAFKIIYDRLGRKADCLTYEESLPALEGNPYVGTVYTTDRSFFSRLQMSYYLWTNHYNLVVHLNTSLKVNATVFMAGLGALRLGYDYKNRGCFLNIRVPINNRTSHGKYRPEEVADLFRSHKAFGWPIPSSDTRMIYEIGEDVPSANLVVVAMCSRTTKHLRQWNKWPQLIDKIIETYGCEVFISGTKNDQDYIKGVMGRIWHKEFVWTGLTSFHGLAKKLKSARLCVSINTATMHLAISQNTPTVAIIGGTPAEVVFPMYDFTRFQYIQDPNLVHGHYAPAMHEITVDQVMHKIARVM
jgi:heptosyltransferase-2